MKVNTQVLDDQVRMLRFLAANTSEMQSAVRHITAVLTGETIGERFRPALNQVISDIGLCAEDLNLLSSVLMQISDAYVQTERRVVEETEYVGIHWQMTQPRLIRLPGIGDLAEGTGTVNGSIDWTPWDPNTET